MIRIRLGTKFRKEEIIRFANAITAITEIPMISVGSILIVTASAEQIPNTCTVIGFSSFNGSLTIFLLRFEKSASAGFFNSGTASSYSSILYLFI
jgi:hypothetical protein